jgi:ParB family transcriptional regulator, chromosome partitioning protein
MVQFYNDSIFWVEVEKIKPNPFQPRREFEQAKLQDLSDSIRQYGILQPLVVTRKEYTKEDGGLAVEYELISGERRLRASKLAGLSQVPVLIRNSEENDLVKLELAIIENLQREDLNPVDRARAFQRLAEDFHFKHSQIAEKMGKSREYVSNSLRILALPSHILDALSEGKISEGHTRPLLMLSDRPEEQEVLFKEIMFKKLTVREAEAIARRVAYDKVRKKEYAVDPEIVEIEEKLAQSFGTRVKIERKDNGGKVMIDFFSADDLRDILHVLENTNTQKDPNTALNRHIENVLAKRRENQISAPVSNLPEKTQEQSITITEATPLSVIDESNSVVEQVSQLPQIEEEKPLDDRPKEEINKAQESDDDNLYSVSNFSI